jgi:hypothetical protein
MLRFVLWFINHHDCDDQFTHRHLELGQVFPPKRRDELPEAHLYFSDTVGIYGGANTSEGLRLPEPIPQPFHTDFVGWTNKQLEQLKQRLNQVLEDRQKQYKKAVVREETSEEEGDATDHDQESGDDSVTGDSNSASEEDAKPKARGKPKSQAKSNPVLDNDSEDEEEYLEDKNPVWEHPYLDHLFKPGSFLAPVTLEGRGILVPKGFGFPMQHRRVFAEFGEGVYLSADTVHAGEVIPESCQNKIDGLSKSRPQWRPGFHCYIDSIFIRRGSNQFAITQDLSILRKEHLNDYARIPGRGPNMLGPLWDKVFSLAKTDNKEIRTYLTKEVHTINSILYDSSPREVFHHAEKEIDSVSPTTLPADQETTVTNQDTSGRSITGGANAATTFQTPATAPIVSRGRTANDHSSIAELPGRSVVEQGKDPVVTRQGESRMAIEETPKPEDNEDTLELNENLFQMIMESDDFVPPDFAGEDEISAASSMGDAKLEAKWIKLQRKKLVQKKKLTVPENQTFIKLKRHRDNHKRKKKFVKHIKSKMDDVENAKFDPSVLTKEEIEALQKVKLSTPEVKAIRSLRSTGTTKERVAGGSGRDDESYRAETSSARLRQLGMQSKKWTSGGVTRLFTK